MTLEATIAAIETLLRQADPALAVRVPGTDATGLSLWPWRFVPVRPIPAQPPSRGPVAAPDAFEVQFLLAMSSDGPAALDRARTLVAQTPVLRIAGGTVALLVDTSLPPAELVALFAAASTPPTLAIALVARVTSG
jgi:hypothetical protein